MLVRHTSLVVLVASWPWCRCVIQVGPMARLLAPETTWCRCQFVGVVRLKKKWHVVVESLVGMTAKTVVSCRRSYSISLGRPKLDRTPKLTVFSRTRSHSLFHFGRVNSRVAPEFCLGLCFLLDTSGCFLFCCFSSLSNDH